jgi:hypothetical protein
VAGQRAVQDVGAGVTTAAQKSGRHGHCWLCSPLLGIPPCLQVQRRAEGGKQVGSVDKVAAASEAVAGARRPGCEPA